MNFSDWCFIGISICVVVVFALWWFLDDDDADLDPRDGAGRGW